MTPLVLGIDLGTSYLKLGLFDAAGQMKGLGRLAIQPLASSAGQCELPTDAFWKSIRTAFDQALLEASARPDDVVAISYATQANSFLLLDAEHRPLTPIVLWPDLRAAAEKDPAGFLRDLDGFMDRSGVGVPLSACFAAAKIRWYAAHEPALWKRCRHVLTISDYLVFGLTGELTGDCGSAALTGLSDARIGAWWREALQACALNDKQMIRLRHPGAIGGATCGPLARELGLPAGIPVAVGSLDHHVAAIGAGAGVLGDCSVSLGTVLACAAPVRRYAPAANLCLAPGIGVPYFALSFSDHGAASLEWYQRHYAPATSIEQLTQSAANVPAHCDGLLAQPGATPPAVRFIGERPEHGQAHHIRAIMESIARGLRSCLATMPAERRSGRILATGGGARSDLWLSILAQHTGAEIIRPDCLEPAARGAAMIAAVAAGWFGRIADATSTWAKAQARFAP